MSDKLNEVKEFGTQIGTSSEADFSVNTWTFQMQNNYKVRAGRFAIVDESVYLMMIKCLDVFATTNIMTAEIRDAAIYTLSKARGDI